MGIAAEWASQNSPGTFYSVGARVTTHSAERYLWSPDGKMVMAYSADVVTNVGYVFTARYRNVYFGGRLISTQGGAVLTDRLGSNVTGGKRYYPYGTERPSASTNDAVKFGTYFRDAESGLDYADQRYEKPGSGRFVSTDPYRANDGGDADVGDPASWNRYAYASSDPVNLFDPSGLASCPAGSYANCVDVVATIVRAVPLMGIGAVGDTRPTKNNNEAEEDLRAAAMQAKFARRQSMTQLAYGLRDKVQNTQGYTNCAAVADFADAAAYDADSIELVEAFGILTPRSMATDLALRFSSSEKIQLYGIGDNGFRSVYKDDGRWDQDQGHHFRRLFPIWIRARLHRRRGCGMDL